MYEFKDRVVAITGGATGIGFALAKAYTSEAMHTSSIITYRQIFKKIRGDDLFKDPYYDFVRKSFQKKHVLQNMIRMLLMDCCLKWHALGIKVILLRYIN